MENETDGREVVTVTNGDAGALELRSAFDVRPQSFKAGLERRKKNREALIEWISSALVEGTDWGRIHVVKRDQCPDGRYCQNPYHFSKPSLWKAGAEKIAGMLGLRVTWPTLVDYERLLLEGKEITQIILRCELLSSAGVVIAEGIGARNLRADGGDLNKALKMAKKSGFIDAVLNVGGLSEVFTQDVEDMDPETIDAGAVDPFNPREEPTRSFFPQGHQKPIEEFCPIGREWKGKPWNKVDDGFLKWIVEHIDDKPEIRAAAQKELDNRAGNAGQDVGQRITQINVGGKKVGDYARELTQAKTLDQVIQIRDDIPPEFEPALRTFIAAREKELGPGS